MENNEFGEVTRAIVNCLEDRGLDRAVVEEAIRSLGEQSLWDTVIGPMLDLVEGAVRGYAEDQLVQDS